MSQGLDAPDRSWWEEWWAWALINNNDLLFFLLCGMLMGFSSQFHFPFCHLLILIKSSFDFPLLRAISVSTCLLLSAHLFASSNSASFFPLSHLITLLSCLHLLLSQTPGWLLKIPPLSNMNFSGSIQPPLQSRSVFTSAVPIFHLESLKSSDFWKGRGMGLY